MLERVHDTLRPLLTTVRLLPDTTDITTVARALNPLQGALANLTATSNDLATTHAPRHDPAAAAKAVDMLTEPRLLPASTLTPEDTLAFLTTTLTAHNEWIDATVRRTAALRDALALTERLARAVDDYADRTKTTGAMDEYLRTDLGGRLNTAITGARAAADRATDTVTTERTRVLPLLEGLRDDVKTIAEYPKDRHLRREVHSRALDAVDTLLTLTSAPVDAA